MYFKKSSKLFFNIQKRFYTTENITRSVYISQSQDIYTNLAFEDWIYNHYDFTNHHILMLWRNNPCIVIGRHQNPWLEVDINHLNKEKLILARRNSGGGTVYHDPGNLNLTFFTCRKHYDRKRNMEFISETIQNKYGIKLNVSPKFDLFSDDNKKLSGTAAKLGRNTAYHHCTLLINVDKTKLNRLLQKRETNIDTNATASIRSSVMNLYDRRPDIRVEDVMHLLGTEYLKNSNNNMYVINPTEDTYPELDKIRNNLISWEWRYGKTPKFKVNITLNSSQILSADVIVINGLIDEVSVKTSDITMNDLKIVSSFEGEKFSNEIVDKIRTFLLSTDLLSLEEKKIKVLS